MSSFERLRRLFKSYTPRIGRGDRAPYTHADARNMINEMAMDIPPKVLQGLLANAEAMEDFVSGLYRAERSLGKSLSTISGEIDPAYSPKALLEENLLRFVIHYRNREHELARFKLNYSKPPAPPTEGEATL